MSVREWEMDRDVPDQRKGCDVPGQRNVCWSLEGVTVQRVSRLRCVQSYRRRWTTADDGERRTKPTEAVQAVSVGAVRAAGSVTIAKRRALPSSVEWAKENRLVRPSDDDCPKSRKGQCGRSSDLAQVSRSVSKSLGDEVCQRRRCAVNND